MKNFISIHFTISFVPAFIITIYAIRTHTTIEMSNELSLWRPIPRLPLSLYLLVWCIIDVHVYERPRYCFCLVKESAASMTDYTYCCHPSDSQTCNQYTQYFSYHVWFYSSRSCALPCLLPAYLRLVLLHSFRYIYNRDHTDIWGDTQFSLSL